MPVSKAECRGRACFRVAVLMVVGRGVGTLMKERETKKKKKKKSPVPRGVMTEFDRVVEGREFLGER